MVAIRRPRRRQVVRALHRRNAERHEVAPPARGRAQVGREVVAGATPTHRRRPAHAGRFALPPTPPTRAARPRKPAHGLPEAQGRQYTPGAPRRHPATKHLPNTHRTFAPPGGVNGGDSDLARSRLLPGQMSPYVYPPQPPVGSLQAGGHWFEPVPHIREGPSGPGGARRAQHPELGSDGSIRVRRLRASGARSGSLRLDPNAIARGRLLVVRPGGGTSQLHSPGQRRLRDKAIAGVMLAFRDRRTRPAREVFSRPAPTTVRLATRTPSSKIRRVLLRPQVARCWSRIEHPREREWSVAPFGTTVFICHGGELAIGYGRRMVEDAAVRLLRMG